MRDVQRHLDAWSLIVIAITLVMFVAALFLKGISHDLLLEGGVFLVSVKLIMMAYKNSVTATRLDQRFDRLENAFERFEALLEARSSSTIARG